MANMVVQCQLDWDYYEHSPYIQILDWGSMLQNWNIISRNLILF